LHFVFASGHPGHSLLRAQAGRALHRLAGSGALTLDFIDGADHTFTQLEARERLVVLLDSLVGGGQPPARPSSAAPNAASLRPERHAA